MAEIIGGVVVVVAFVAFVLWNNRGRPKRPMTAADRYKEEWWGEREGRERSTTRAGQSDEDTRDED